MENYSAKYAAFAAAKTEYAKGTMTYETLQEIYNKMRFADEDAEYEIWEGSGHWAPSCWDRNLPAPLRKKARDIGRRLRTRLEAAWSEEKKCRILFGPEDRDDGFDFYLDAKEQHRILVSEYMRSLPESDPDMVEYAHLRDNIEDYRMPEKRPEPPAPGEGKSRTARARRARRARAAAGN